MNIKTGETMLTEQAAQAYKQRFMDVIRHEFPNIELSDITLKPAEDFYGDPIIHIYIKYTAGELDGDRVIVIDRIRDILQADKDFTFPILNFVKERNIPKRKRVA